MKKTDGIWNPAERGLYFLAATDDEYFGLLMKNTDGTWDMGERGQYFLATDHGMTSYVLDADGLMYPYLLVAVNEIDARMEATMNRAAAAGAHWFIDSGIFWLTNEHKRAHGISMDEALALAPEEIDGFDALFEKYVAIVRRWKDKAWGYIELDQGGRENKIRTRARLESMGLNPIPVYHPLNDGWDYFDELAQNYDRICFGNVVQANAPTRKRLLATLWERKQRYPNLWVHLLGYTPNQFLNAYPIDSADSSSWLSVVRWSGYNPRAQLKALGKMNKNYQYVLGQTDLEGRDYRKSVRMSAYGFIQAQRNWRNHLEALRALGATPYPGQEAHE